MAMFQPIVRSFLGRCPFSTKPIHSRISIILDETLRTKSVREELNKETHDSNPQQSEQTQPSFAPTTHYQSFASQFLGKIDPEYSRPVAGRAWRTFELRDKSTTDLQTLFFILVKEKNTLLSIRRAFEKDDLPFTEKNRARKVKQSLARLRTVFSERNRQHEKAMLTNQMMMIHRYRTSAKPDLQATASK
eukprot:TRINITY_DN849_c0_g4_i1.p1 TRINITY_DN849_c0_g4~~TRINITY_DN849_c0_g4_i1.p1  ORF type:complete len:190 (+),score=43.40 TRINITY_DN849_c0_g4_i1:80-649(+)